MPRINMGDIVEYQGERWEVGFVNNHMTGYAGTVRLQKGPSVFDKQANYIPIEDLKAVRQ